MAIDADFLNGIFANETDSVEAKVQQIITEYNADITGLKNKNQELIGKEKTYKQSIADYETGKANFEKQIAELSEQIKSKSDDKTKEFYEAKLAKQLEDFAKEKDGYLGQISELNKYKLNDIKSKAIAKGIEGIKFVDDTYKDAMIALIMSRENFEPTEIDGETLYLNKDKKLLSDVIKDYALSEMGRKFIANTISGGGGAPNADKPLGNMSENPFKTGDLDAQMKLYKENKPLAIRLAKEAGVNLE